MQNTGLTQASYSRQLGQGIFYLLEISHSKFSQTYRLVDNTKNIVSDNQEFGAYPFKLELSPEGEDGGVSLTLSNSSAELIKEIRATDNSNEDIKVSIWIVRSNKDGVSERVFKGDFITSQLVISIESISTSLAFDTCLPFNAGGLRFNQKDFPNIYL